MTRHQKSDLMGFPALCRQQTLRPLLKMAQNLRPRPNRLRHPALHSRDLRKLPLQNLRCEISVGQKPGHHHHFFAAQPPNGIRIRGLLFPKRRPHLTKNPPLPDPMRRLPGEPTGIRILGGAVACKDQGRFFKHPTLRRSSSLSGVWEGGWHYAPPSSVPYPHVSREKPTARRLKQKPAAKTGGGD